MIKVLIIMQMLRMRIRIINKQFIQQLSTAPQFADVVKDDGKHSYEDKSELSQLLVSPIR